MNVCSQDQSNLPPVMMLHEENKYNAITYRLLAGECIGLVRVA